MYGEHAACRRKVARSEKVRSQQRKRVKLKRSSSNALAHAKQQYSGKPWNPGRKDEKER
jgi:hypothetical protein